jgi:serine/threonine protein kinase
MEDGGKSLIDYMTELKTKKITIPKDILERWIIELIEFFAQMNNHGINHCNIKPHNILINERNMSIKVIDFNINRMAGEVQPTMSITGILPIQGTEGYMAPELVQAQRDNLNEIEYEAEKSDVFSLGLTFLQMITLDKIEGYNMIENNTILMNEVNNLNCDDWIKIMLNNMLVIDMRKRMNFTKLLQFSQNKSSTDIL